MLLKNVYEEVPIDVNLIDTPGKNSPSTTVHGLETGKLY